jgi:uncharacterized protein (TIGR03435 family)
VPLPFLPMQCRAYHRPEAASAWRPLYYSPFSVKRSGHGRRPRLAMPQALAMIGREQEGRNPEPKSAAWRRPTPGPLLGKGRTLDVIDLIAVERRDRLWLPPCAVTVCLTVLATAQLSREDAHLKFEVASVKLDRSGDGVRGGCHGADSIYSPAAAGAWSSVPNATLSPPPLGRCVVTSARIGHLISIAWGLPMRLIEGEPDWGDGSDRFRIDAKTEEPEKTTEAQLLAMLQTLLMERFQLKFHRQTVEQAGFALVVGKNGPQMRPAKSGDVVTSFGNQLKPSRDRGKLAGRTVTIARLVEILSFIRSAPVVDKTGLGGAYDFTLNWDEDAGPTLRTAVEEQLGLKLEPQKAPVSLFVIESAQKPSPN